MEVDMEEERKREEEMEVEMEVDGENAHSTDATGNLVFLRSGSCSSLFRHRQEICLKTGITDCFQLRWMAGRREMRSAEVKT